MTLLPHLNTDQFDHPVVFRLVGVSDEALVPGYDIERHLETAHGLSEDSIDIAATVDEPRREFAFDGDAVTDVDDVLNSVREMIHSYNTVPDWLDETEMSTEEWRTTHHVDMEVLLRIQ